MLLTIQYLQLRRNIFYVHSKTKNERKAMLGVEMPKEPANRDDNYYEPDLSIDLPSSVRAFNELLITLYRNISFSINTI